MKRLKTNKHKEIILPIKPHQWEQYFLKLVAKNRQRQTNRTTQTIEVTGSLVITKGLVQKVCKELKNSKSPETTKIHRFAQYTKNV